MFDFFHRNRAWVLLFTMILIVFSALGAARLKVSTDNRIFYGPENPYFRDYLAFENEFTANDNILFVIAAPYTVVERDFPRAIRWLADKASGLSHVLRTDSLANYPHPTSEGDTLVVQSLLDWACHTESSCRPDVSEVLSNAHLVNRLVSSDYKATGVLATVSIQRGVVGEIEELHEEARELVSAFEHEFPDFSIYFTGGVPMMAAFAEETAKDLTLLLPLALLTIFILLSAVLGSLKIASIIVGVALISIIGTLGLAGWSGHTLNNATSIVPLIVFTLVVASSMHIAVHFSSNLGRMIDSESAARQAKASVSSSIVPVAISAATSIVSLFSLYLVDSPPIRELGILSAAGVAIGAISSVVLLPQALATVRRVSDNQLNGLIQSFVNRYAKRLEFGRDQWLTTVVLLAVSCFGLAHLEINDDFVEFFDDEVEFRVQTDRVTGLLAGPNHIEIVATNPAGSVFEPEFLSYLSRLTEHVRSKPLVANAHSFSDVIGEISDAFSATPIGASASADEIAQLFLIYELSLQRGQSNTDLLNASQDSARVSVLLKKSTSAEIQKLESQLYEWGRRQDGPYTLLVTGENIPVAHLSETNIRSMMEGILFSLTFTAVVLGTTFRSLRLGVVALMATVIPVVAGFGAWGWITEEIGLAATAIVALTIGVVVDDAAHYIYRYLDARNRLMLEPWPAAAYATHRAGTAIVSTSVVMGMGLSLLLASNFAVNSSFGAVACLIIAVALAFDLGILPRLVAWAVPSKAPEVESIA